MELVVDRGFEEVTVEMVVAEGGVDRSAFDRHFSGVEDCAVQAYMRNNERFGDVVFGAYEAHRVWRDGLRAAAYAAARFLRDHPLEVRFNVVQVLSAGPMALAQRDAYLQKLVELVDDGRRELEDPDSMGRSVAEGVIGSIFERMLGDVSGRGGVMEAESLVPELMYIAVRPYLGHEVAQEERTIPRPPESGTTRGA